MNARRDWARVRLQALKVELQRYADRCELMIVDPADIAARDYLAALVAEEERDMLTAERMRQDAQP